MIRKQTFSGYNEMDCFERINSFGFDEEKIISVIPRGHKTFQGDETYLPETYCVVDVIYRD